MSYSKRPETIVLKNEFYPRGLTEYQIWNHYQLNKSKILEQNKNRNMMMFLILKNGKFIVKRNVGELIKLTPSNYDTIISGRSISLHGLMNKVEDMAIIDIDSDNFLKNKQATKEIFELFYNKNSLVKDCKIRYTGKTGFHIACELTKKMNIDVIRMTFQKLIKASNIADKYTIKSKRTSEKVNIDLYRNAFNVGFISLNALSIIGLKCMEVPYDKIYSFSKKEARI